MLLGKELQDFAAERSRDRRLCEEGAQHLRECLRLIIGYVVAGRRDGDFTQQLGQRAVHGRLMRPDSHVTNREYSLSLFGVAKRNAS